MGNRLTPTIYNVNQQSERLTKGSLTQDHGFGAVVALNGHIYLLGGENNPTMVERFDAEHETFSSMRPDSSLFQSRLFHGKSRFGYTAVPASWFSHLDCTHR